MDLSIGLNFCIDYFLANKLSFHKLNWQKMYCKPSLHTKVLKKVEKNWFIPVDGKNASIYGHFERKLGSEVLNTATSRELFFFLNNIIVLTQSTFFSCFYNFSFHGILWHFWPFLSLVFRDKTHIFFFKFLLLFFKPKFRIFLLESKQNLNEPIKCVKINKRTKLPFCMHFHFIYINYRCTDFVYLCLVFVGFFFI